MTPLPCLIHSLCNCLWLPPSAGLCSSPWCASAQRRAFTKSLSLSVPVLFLPSLVILAFPSHLSYPPFLFHPLRCLSSLIPSFPEQGPALDPACPQDLSKQPEVGEISVGALLSRQASHLSPSATAFPHKWIKPFPSPFPGFTPGQAPASLLSQVSEGSRCPRAGRDRSPQQKLLQPFSSAAFLPEEASRRVALLG